MLCFLFTISYTVYSQENLIYNGDFEEHLSCPANLSDPFQVPYEIEKCSDWKAPNFGTSDFFSTCATTPVVQIPNNSVGFQYAKSGNSYLGLGCIYQTGMGTDGYNGPMWWEYIQGHLTKLLEQGKVYRFSMEISLAEYSDLMITELGVYFSDVPISSPNTAVLTVAPQIVFIDSDHYSDTVNWIHLEALYQATGTEKYITIGNFRDNLTTDTLRRYSLGSQSNNPNTVYFYVDDVQLIDYSWEKDPTNVFTPNGDGLNDLWTLPYSDKKNPKTVTIINRWGELIKEGDLNGFEWDGKTQNGEECSDGTYFFKISNTNIAGFIQLIR